MSTGSTGSSRRERISESALNPMDGSLKCQLNCSILHLPVKPKMNKKKTYCQHHYWCNNEQKCSNTVFCYNCNVVLCVNKCYEIFHTKFDLHKMKSKTKKKSNDWNILLCISITMLLGLLNYILMNHTC